MPVPLKEYLSVPALDKRDVHNAIMNGLRQKISTAGQVLIFRIESVDVCDYFVEIIDRDYFPYVGLYNLISFFCRKHR